MRKTTFFTAEIAGPSIPFSAVDVHVTSGPDASPEYIRMARLQEKASTIVTGHRAGVWNRETLSRLAARRGIVITRAYWLNRSDRHGYAGAVEHAII